MSTSTAISSASEVTVSERSTLGRSTWAVLAGFISVVVLSLGVDQVLHVLQVYPPWSQPMWDPKLNMLALSYRLVFGVAGPYLTARLAPHAPLKHALILGGIGFVVSTLGMLAALNAKLGPAWYPAALVVTSLPTAWLGGALYVRGRR